MAEFLINERSRALLHLIDAFKLSESELRDVWDGIFNRISEIAEIVRDEEKGKFPSKKPLTSEVVEEMIEDYPDYPNSVFKPIGFDDPMMYACDMCQGSGYIESTDDTEDWECPKCDGSGVLSEDYIVSQELKDEEDNLEELVDDEEDKMSLCPRCHGNGELESFHELRKCDMCGGTGTLDHDVEELVDSDEFEELMEEYIAEVEEKGGIPF
ncbi:hypothetical protein [Pseudanabaena yagii]|uniref:CR-type domain-containing protein n=1 Tax=Pseudanabaena yagii GIHE-NHR1 TaxID=2722753 RepID=A0ABX1LLU6_9CYAN|nr:hypothetical protein [Pseudanabaena yagii]NMF57094.1 hypothetical protein [Pseudanabaena yagii GIHE-NHR1]